jgi:hypothetical protein
MADWAASDRGREPSEAWSTARRSSDWAGGATMAVKAATTPAATTQRRRPGGRRRARGERAFPVPPLGGSN